MNNRDHRKIMVIDGQIAFVGGFGISDDWTGHGQDRDHWRDTGVRITGPVVAPLQGAFSENWIEETGEIPAGPKYFPPIAPTGTVPIHVAYTSPAGTATSAQILHYLTIASAQRSIKIQNAYLIHDDDTLTVLGEAVKRGVNVRIMVPAANATDSAIVQHASHHRYGELLKRGVKLWEFDRTLLHQKVMTIDGKWSGVGSTNFDARSFQLNDEVSVGILDPVTAAGLEQAFADDLRDANPQSLEQWKHRSLWHKTIDQLAYLLHEQL
jgi:cardiolipin synthase